ncbi:zinc-ribbon domain-containing protein [Tardiphaga alba]|uniref:Zinc-ribbon domain-containing protein n=1 Tax=Tardiphaga alba TaxID=340268 RepID=A0ABX8AA37_9BRAD|nr:zinc-ribbon domain-containing protein [Tardiphaga alba]QUS40634.1 zinc-ribbon domain-containing protein [Tardiphaga alba]
MIIWGSYVTKKIIQKGEFFCPGCAQHRQYNLRRPKKWGHLYWIPLIPMQELDRYVQCTACDKAWNESVLEHDPIREQHQRDENLATMLAQLMLLMSGEGGLTPKLNDQITEATQRLIGVDATPESIAKAVMSGSDRNSALSNTARQADGLNDRGKEATLRAVIAIAPARPLGEREWMLASDIGKHLGMSPAHVGGVLSEMAAA